MNNLFDGNNITNSYNQKYLKSNDNSNTNTITSKLNLVENITNTLVNDFHAEDSRLFFYKCAWHLSEAQIINYKERALQNKTPLRLFIWLCKQDLDK